MPVSDSDDEFDDGDERSAGPRERSEAEDLRDGRRMLSRGRMASLADRLTGGPARPGEQQVLRSPLVLGLAGAAAGLGILAVIFFYVISTEGEKRRLNEAKTALEQKKYAESEQLFDRFLEAYPDAGSTEEARLCRYRARIEKWIMTTTPDVILGLKELEELLIAGKDLDGFSGERENIRMYADRLAFAGARVAEISQQQEPLDVSIRAMEILRRYSPEAGIPGDREADLIQRQRIAEAAIAKRIAFKDAVEEIRRLIESGQTIPAIERRQTLLDRYPVLSDDKDVAAVLSEILAHEQKSVQIVAGDSGSAAVAGSEDAKSGDVVPSISLAVRTQVAGDQISGDRRIFAVGTDCVYALDAGSGEPIWKRVIGRDTAFSPVSFSGSSNALLVHSPRTSELLMLNLNDGKLIWKRKISARPVGDPLIHQNRVYLTLSGGDLYEIAVDDGRIISQLHFSQNMAGPPSLTSDGQRMLIVGDSMMVYTLTLSPLSCQNVSYIDHRAGSVNCPLVTAGSVYVMCDNNEAAKCRVRVLEMAPETGLLKVRAAEYVDGQVLDPCLLRGGELFVPSTPQRVTAFRISDEADQAAITRIGANQLEEGLQTRMYLLAGPGGQLWLGGRSLRKFQLRTNGLQLAEGTLAKGIHLQPVQFVDEAVFLTSRLPTLSSVFFTRADREEMTDTWRTAVSTNIIAVGAGPKSLVAVTDYGKVFQLAYEKFTAGGFLTDAISEYQLPERLDSSVSGLELRDGRCGAWCGAPQPALWTITAAGQLEQKWNLPGVPDAAPVAIGAGVVFGLPGRLHLTAMRGGVAAEDYRAAQTGSEQQGWKSLVSAGGNQVLAITRDNRLIRVEYREKPRPQLTEVSATKLSNPVDVTPAVAAGVICLATSDGHLLAMRDPSMELIADVDLGGIPGKPPMISGNRVFVEVGGQRVRVFALDRSLESCGEFTLDEGALADTPFSLPDGRFVAIRSSGKICRLSSDGVPEGEFLDLEQKLARGPFPAGNNLLVLSADGTIFSLPSEFSR